MNITPDALDRAYQAALTSGKVEGKRLARALQLIPQVQHTYSGTHTDGVKWDEYWMAGTAHTGYSITVTDGKRVSACTCKDTQERQVAYCKHRLAVMLITRALSYQPEAVTVQPVSAPLSADYRAKLKAALWPQDAD